VIEIGGTASGTTVSGGSEIVSAGGTATAAMIGPGGVEIVTDGGLDVGATIAGGTQDITGLAIGAQIASSGSAMLSAGGAMVSASLRRPAVRLCSRAVWRSRPWSIRPRR